MNSPGNSFARIALLAILLINPTKVWGNLVTLYSGTGLPTSEPWLAFGANGLNFSQSAQAGGVLLTSSQNESVGYGNRNLLGLLRNPAFPALDRSSGYELAFGLTVNSESHISNDRAGFSLTLLGSDSMGIELGFWQDQIWAQSGPNFQRAEFASINTGVNRNYRLRILNDGYTLFADGNAILSNTLRNYAPSGTFPYNLPNMLFLGDNTSRAAASVLIGQITLQTNLVAVPEPSSLWLAMAGAGLICQRRRRRS